MTFDYSQYNLPVADAIGKLDSQLSAHNTLLLTAPPGAGKSTLLPLALMSHPLLRSGKILMLEPRRLAARSIASRMADMLGEKTGQTVGYRIRFETCVSAHTRIEVLTEGILTRMLQSDNELQGVAAVIFDEFHERSLNADVALALCRECQQVLRSDLRILIMSATLNMPRLQKLLNAPVIESKGRQFPVTIVYADECDPYTIAELTTHTILKALREHDGDLLAFLPGEAEIRKCEEMLRATVNEDIRIHPLYGMLPQKEQTAAILPNKEGKRKIVLATSIAETSLTIEGIKIVVDCGFCRIQRFDPDTSLSRLETVRISHDMADQRAGRAGRLCEGYCYRMWSKATHSKMADNRLPEIEYADLAPLVLNLAQWGETDADRLTWLSPPPAGHIMQAKDLLMQLEAIDANGRITSHGTALQHLPCHPRIAQMLLAAKEMELLPLATDIAALLDDRDPLPKESGTDLNLRIEALRRNRAQHRNNRALDRVERNAAAYRQIFNTEPDNNSFNCYDTGLLLAQAFPERIASAKPGNNAQFMLSNGSMAMTDAADPLAAEPWLTIASLNARDGMGRIFLASPLDPQDLKPMIKLRNNVSWSTKKGGITAQQEMRIGSIVLQSKPLQHVDRELVASVICEAVKHEGESLLNFSEEVQQWQCRVMSLRQWHPDDNWPDVSTQSLIATCDEWLAPYLPDINTASALKRLNLQEALQYHLDYTQQQQLSLLAPTHLEVPSGSHIRLEYKADGSQPVLSVRLQEVFGLADTPCVDNGKQAVLMQLLSPGFKPVQLTSDLRSFWNNAYFDVKKELRTRYPKHVWPDDPWNEPAIRGTKRKKTN
jgi:ATP-dependent helicase HrpB